MSKRNADVQITKEGGEMMSQDTWGSGDGPQRASAAQMAGRKLARPRGARRPPGGFHPAGATSASIQQSFPPFGQSNGAQQASTMFRPSTNLNPQLSQSFPQPNASNNNNNAGSNTSFTAPTGAFSFSTAPSQNPFAISNQNETTPVKGFHGTIFNFDTPAAPAEKASGNTNPLFAPGAPEFPKFEQSKPGSNGITWPAVTQQAQPSANLFTTPQVQQQQSQSIFAKPTDSSNSMAANMFGGFNAPSVQQPSDPQPDILQQLTGAPPPASEVEPAQSLFARFTPKPQQEPKTNPFANIMSSSNQTSSNPFASLTSAKPQPSVNLFAQDSMQTSPDNTPAKTSEPLFKPFVFTPQTSESAATSPTKAPPATQNIGVLGQDSQVDSTASVSATSTADASPAAFSIQSQVPAPASDNLFKKPESQGTGRSLFDRITKPDPPATSSSQSQPPSVNSTPAVSNGMFAHLGEPASAAAPAQGFGASGIQNPFAKFMSADSATEPSSLTQVETPELSTQKKTSESVSDIPQSISTPGAKISGMKPLSEFAHSSPSQASMSGHPTVAKGVDIGPTDVPIPPSSFSAEERQQVIIGWRLRNLDAGIEAGIISSMGSDLHRINRFHNLKRKMIEEAGDSPMGSLLPAKRHKSNAELPPLGSTNIKRKADDQVGGETIGSGADRAKRSRGEDATPKSQTSSLFSSIVSQNKSQDGSSASAVDGGAFDTVNGSVSFGKASSKESSSANLFKAAAIPSEKTSSAETAQLSAPAATGQPLQNPFAKLSASTNIEPPASTAIKPPTFNVNPTNFMAQFGAAAKKHEEEQKKKRKAEEYDSDEDNEEDWEKKDAEQQQLKRQKFTEAAKSAKSFVPITTTQTDSLANPKEKEVSTSIFDQVHPAFGPNNPHNIFGHLRQETDGGETPEPESASDEGDLEDDDTPKQAATDASAVGKSLRDRISRPDTSEDGQGDRAGDVSADHTWKADSPIKFNSSAATSSAPAISITSASSSKSPAAGLFGAGTAATPNPLKPASSHFANLTSSTTSGGLVGFGFAPAKGAAANLVQPSPNTSRATSPGATTGDSATESANENTDDAAPKQEQIDLMSQRPGEENEDVVFEAPRVKALKYLPKEGKYESQGVGPLRVLKHRETGKRRVIVRQDPNNSIIINSGFVKDGKYEFIGMSTVRCVFSDRSGSPCVWQIRVRDEGVSKEMAKIFIENKEYGA